MLVFVEFPGLSLFAIESGPFSGFSVARPTRLLHPPDDLLDETMTSLAARLKRTPDAPLGSVRLCAGSLKQSIVSATRPLLG